MGAPALRSTKLQVPQGPLVTVGIPILNAESTLCDAVRSVFAQSERRWVLVLIDDGSRDRSREIIQSISDPRVTAVSDGQRLGLSRRLNQLSNLATTPYLARMDADDMMHPDRLAFQLDYLEKDKRTSVLGCGAYVINDQSQVLGCRRGKSVPQSFFAVLARGLYIHPTTIGRLQWFRDNQYDPHYVRAEDRELWCRAWNTTTFGVIPDPLFFYRDLVNYRADDYTRSLRTERRLITRYKDRITPSQRARLLMRIGFRVWAYRFLLSMGAAGFLARRRNEALTQEERDEAMKTIRGIRSTRVPGFLCEGQT